jgi:energy-coupling factor transport system ATP-binding protein
MSIEVHNLSFSYSMDRYVLKAVTLTARPGEFLLIVGKNGVGKSTLLKLLNGILKPTSGRVLINGLDTREHPVALLAGKICVTFQNPADQIFAPTVSEEVAFAPRNLKRTNPESIAEKALRLCGLEHRKSSHPYDLPPAERKLLTVASAVASDAPYLAFDEPSAGLSYIERNLLEHIIQSLLTEGKGLIVVSHDLPLFFKCAARVVVLENGSVSFSGHVQELIEREGILRRAGLRLPLPVRAKRILGVSK